MLGDSSREKWQPQLPLKHKPSEKEVEPKPKQTRKKKVKTEEPKEVPAATKEDLLPQEAKTSVDENGPAAKEPETEPTPEPEPEEPKKLPPPDLEGLKIVKGEKMEKAEIQIRERDGEYHFLPSIFFFSAR